MAFTALGFDGSVNAVQAATWTPALGVEEGVLDGMTAQVVVGVDRTVRVAPGVASAWGVRVASDASSDVQGAVVSSGSRWDTICVRREWGPRLSSIVLVGGSAAKAVAAGVLATPGVSDDQPIWLVRFQAGLTAPQELFDLRKFVFPLTTVNDTALPAPAGYHYGQAVVQNVGAGGLDLAVRRGGPGGEIWQRMLGPSWANVTLTAGYIALSDFSIPRVTVSGGLVRFEGGIKRSAGQPFYASHGTYSNVANISAILGPDRPCVFPSLKNDCGMIVNTDGSIDLDINEDTSYVRCDGATWFPSG
jgi:hypothetical protein